MEGLTFNPVTSSLTRPLPCCCFAFFLPVHHLCISSSRASLCSLHFSEPGDSINENREWKVKGAAITINQGSQGYGAGGLKFRRQQSIGPFILDFYCPEYRLGIELDGTSHDYKYEYDETRTEYLHGQGIRILRFTNQQVFTSLEAVLAEIVSAAKGCY